MRRVTLIGIVALLAVGAAWWITQRSPPAPLSASEPVATAARPVEIPDPALEPVEPQAVRSAVSGAGTAVTESPAAAVISESATLELHGTVVVLDEAGVEHTTENGSLDLEAWGGRTIVPVHAVVVGGKWTLELDRCEKLFVSSALLGGRTAFDPGTPKTPAVPGPGSIDLRLTWARPLVLHARDAVSNRDLGEIEVLTANAGWGFDVPAVPDESRSRGSVVLRGSSPLTILPTQIASDLNARIFYVRAPGYAWSNVEFDRRIGGDVFVELVPTAALDVELSGNVRERKATLRLLPVPRGRPLYETLVVNRTQFAIEDVPAGKYVVAVEVGEEFQNPVSLARTEVDLVGGTRLRVELHLTAPAPIARATLSGLMRIPAAWKSQRAGVTAGTIDERGFRSSALLKATLGAVAHGPNHDDYPWTFVDAAVGRYLLTTGDPPFVILADLDASGTSDVLIEIPPPANVSVRLIDAVTSEPVAIETVEWTYKLKDVPSGQAGRPVTRNATTNTFEFQCPIGDVEISALAGSKSGYETPRKEVRVVAGENLVTIPLSKSTGVVLRVMDGDVELPVRGPGTFQIVSLIGDEEPRSWTYGGPTTTAQVPKPGQYRIKLKKPVAGYLLPEDTIVDLQPGTMTDVVIRLTRKP